MCGTDLPGNVYASPAPEDREAVARVVTQGHDALEMTVIEAPVAGATSLSGIQPKLGLVEHGGRYVARTRDSRSSTHIIAKLPANAYPLLPEVEALSLRLARAAGVHTCDAELRPMTDIVPQDQPFTLDSQRRFLAVRRFDRGPQGHIHCEDFAQILGLDPESKYADREGRANYASVLLTLHAAMGIADAAGAHEVMRRLMVNEMLGNYDAHLKNVGVMYPDGVTPVLVRQLCNLVGLVETRVKAVLADTVERARTLWPAMIKDSALTDAQRSRLLEHFHQVPAVQAQARRSR